MSMRDDVGLAARASAQLLAKPAALWREWMLLLHADVRRYYDFMGDDVLEAPAPDFERAERPLWLNLGYWKRATRYDDACADLARALAGRAQLGPGQRVLDVGFGFGEQDLLWVRELDVGRIIGLNVTPSHVAIARRRVQDSGLEDRIDLRLGSATEIPLDDDSVDRVVALESAFHFDTRERFFAEALRVLRPGGILATADCLPLVGERPGRLIDRLAWRRWSIPAANMYDREVYCDKLRACGFQRPECESIRGYVFPGIDHYRAQRQKGVLRGSEQVRLTSADIERCAGVEEWRKLGGLTDYVLVSAVKP